jgi:hypothetical protein
MGILFSLYNMVTAKRDNVNESANVDIFDGNNINCCTTVYEDFEHDTDREFAKANSQRKN